MRALVFPLLVSAPLAFAEEARALMQRSEDAHRVAFERIRSQMVLQEAGGAPRERSLVTWSSSDVKAGDKTRLRFESPADVKGTGLLSVERPGSDEEQWLYLPAFKKTRRVGQSELGDRFVGTDFFYEDLKRRRVDDYAHALLEASEVDGQPCWVVESVPTAPAVVKETPYGKSQTWLRKDTLAPVRVRLFDKKLEPLKQLEFAQLVAVSKTAWRPNAVTVVDLKRKHRTVVTVLDRQVKPEPDDVFTVRHLESE